MKFSDILIELYRGKRVSRRGWIKDKFYAEFVGDKILIMTNDTPVAEIINRDYFSFTDDWFVVGEETAEDLAEHKNRDKAFELATEAAKAMNDAERR